MRAASLRRLGALEARAGINALSAMSDADLQEALAAALAGLGDVRPPEGLSLPALIAWLERDLAGVH